jgi:hypothetical protein
MKLQFHCLRVDGLQQYNKGNFLEREVLPRDILLAKAQVATSIQTHSSSRQTFMAVTVIWPVSNFRSNSRHGDSKTDIPHDMTYESE